MSIMKAKKEITVTPELSAKALGSGSLMVYGTPAMVALMEETAQMAVSDLKEGETTVGTLVNVKHVKALAIGAKAICTATMLQQEGRRLTFHIEVTNEAGELLGEAEHERFIVDANRFMSKLN